jgi:hypothetical protein
MQAKSPVVEGLEPYEIVLGSDQPQYQPLHVLRTPGPSYGVMSRWVPSEEERKLIAEGADIYLTLWTFGNSYPPTMIHAMHANTDADAVREQMDLNTELSQRLGALLAIQQLNTQKSQAEAEQNEQT